MIEISEKQFVELLSRAFYIKGKIEDNSGDFLTNADIDPILDILEALINHDRHQDYLQQDR